MSVMEDIDQWFMLHIYNDTLLCVLTWNDINDITPLYMNIREEEGEK
jgi:hypothetical protein